MLEGAGGCWRAAVGIGGCGKAEEGARRCWRVLEGAGERGRPGGGKVEPMEGRAEEVGQQIATIRLIFHLNSRV